MRAESIEPAVYSFVNRLGPVQDTDCILRHRRLSDYLFVAARTASKHEGGHEAVYKVSRRGAEARLIRSPLNPKLD